MPFWHDELLEFEAKFPIVRSKTKSKTEVRTFVDYLKCKEI